MHNRVPFSPSSITFLAPAFLLASLNLFKYNHHLWRFYQTFSLIPISNYNIVTAQPFCCLTSFNLSHKNSFTIFKQDLTQIMTGSPNGHLSYWNSATKMCGQKAPLHKSKSISAALKQGSLIFELHKTQMHSLH